MTCNVPATQVVVPFFAGIMSTSEAEAVSKTFVDRCYREIREKPKEELEDNEGEDLCNAEFSLAYGASMPKHVHWYTW